MKSVEEHAVWTNRSCKAAVRALRAAVVLLPLMATTVPAQEAAPSYSVLYSFTSGAGGGSPFAGLIADAAGNLYGTTQLGGDTSCNPPSGCGVIFKLDRAGNETELYTFTGGTDGSKPQAGLIQDSAGNLYGTTRFGGDTSGLCSGLGCGVIFKLDPSGNETVLYSFTGGADGGFPVTGLVRDPSGSFYGTTPYGGGCGGSGCGVVFKLDPKGLHYRVMYRFTGRADGGVPAANLIRDAAGNLYGTTVYGGSFSHNVSGSGVVFKLDAAGNETVLYTFTGGADGGNPQASLIRDAAGNLYGTATFGGNPKGSCGSLGCGVVFQLAPSGNESVLYTFSGGADGANPYPGLIQDAAGNLYGTTAGGGLGFGTVFKLDLSGSERVLYSFTGGADGSGPLAGLLSYNGSLYGTTYAGGNAGCNSYPLNGCGVVFKLH